MSISSTAQLTVIGLMSGTSVDGIDAAIVRIKGSGTRIRMEILSSITVDYPEPVKSEIFNLFSIETTSVDKISAMNFLLGELFADAALTAIDAAGLSTDDIDLIASHGQTIWHEPNGMKIAGRNIRSTLQIGEPNVISEKTGLTVAADFRTADMAAGGQGAPLVTYADYVLFSNPSIIRAVQNIGGIANVTYLPDSDMDRIIAFDTGPGNMLIDAAANILFDLPHDKDGKIAATGQVKEPLVNELLSHPYFLLHPPKSTGRELFGVQFLKTLLNGPMHGLSTKDIIATLTAFTARSISDQYRRWLPKMPDEVILGGGGVHNQTLMRMLEEALAPAKLKTHEDFGISNDAKEAVAFAILASETVRGVPSNVPAATGASHPAILGKIYPGRNWINLQQKLSLTNLLG